MCEKRLKEEEEKLKINQNELEELNEDIDNIHKRIFKYSSKIEAIDEDNTEELIMWLNRKSSCYMDLSKKTSEKNRILKYIKDGKAMIEVWKQNLKQSSQHET